MENPRPLEELQRLVEDIGALQIKLLLIIGPPGSSRSRLLHSLAWKEGCEPLNVSAMLSGRLSAVPQTLRCLQTNNLLRDLADQHAKGDLLLLDNIELLFDRALQLDPLDSLKKLAHARRVVAAWPGELHNGRLTYANMGHPEYQDHDSKDLVLFKIQ